MEKGNGWLERMDMEKEILEKMAALGIEQRKILREQKGLTLTFEELKAGLVELKAAQRELAAMMMVLNERLQEADQLPVPGPKSAKVWLDAYDAKELLKIGNRTLWRRRDEGTFVAKKIGKKWFYLKSSLQ